MFVSTDIVNGCVIQTGNHGSCRQDIVREKWIYRCDTYDKTMARDIHGWMPFTENVMVCDIYLLSHSGYLKDFNSR